MPERTFELVYHEKPYTNIIPFDEIPEELRSKFGRGIGFPPDFNVVENKWAVAEGTNKISQSLFIMLTTPIGTRLNRPDFGSMLPLMVFGTVDDIFEAEIIQNTRDAIDKWEPRITVQKIELNKDYIANSMVQVRIFFTINGVGSPGLFNLGISSEGATPVFYPTTDYQLAGQNVFEV